MEFDLSQFLEKMKELKLRNNETDLIEKILQSNLSFAKDFNYEVFNENYGRDCKNFFDYFFI